jgi:hypothetical protein
MAAQKWGFGGWKAETLNNREQLSDVKIILEQLAQGEEEADEVCPAVRPGRVDEL